MESPPSVANDLRRKRSSQEANVNTSSPPHKLLKTCNMPPSGEPPSDLHEEPSLEATSFIEPSLPSDQPFGALSGCRSQATEDAAEPPASSTLSAGEIGELKSTSTSTTDSAASNQLHGDDQSKTFEAAPLATAAVSVTPAGATQAYIARTLPSANNTNSKLGSQAQHQNNAGQIVFGPLYVALKEVESQHRSIISTNSSEISRLQAIIRELRSHKKVCDDAVEKAESVQMDQEDPSRPISALERAKEEDLKNRKLIRSLQEQLKEKHDSMAHLSQTIKEQTISIVKLQEKIKTVGGWQNQLDWDSEILKAYKTLDAHVSNVCHNFRGRPFTRAASELQKIFFNEMAPSDIWTEYLADKEGEGKYYLIQAAVWHFVCKKILDQPLGVYEFATGTGAFRLERAALGEAPNLERTDGPDAGLARIDAWRSQTGRLLHDNFAGADTVSFTPEYCDDLANEMSTLFKKWHSGSDQEKEGLPSHFKPLLERAKALAQLIARADARYVLTYEDMYLNKKRFGFKANKATMDIVFSDDWGKYGVPVTFVIKPGLARRHTTDADGNVIPRKIMVKTEIAT